MPDAISNTSPVLYLYRIGHAEWLRDMFDIVWVTGAVVQELEEGRAKGYDVPRPASFAWMKCGEPRFTPSEWLALDLGSGELATMSLALEHPERIVLLDDGLARRVAKAAGLTVWGTLKVVLEAKERGLIESVEPVIARLSQAGMWIAGDVRSRILRLAGESV